MNIYRLKACRKCKGDLARDDGDWRCLQCGSYSYVGLYRQPMAPVIPAEQPGGDLRDPGGSSGAQVQCATGLIVSLDKAGCSPVLASVAAGPAATARR